MGHFRKNLITFNMTNQCNLRCSYCWENMRETRPAKTLDLDFAKQGLRDFYQHTGSNYLGFTGGEATLAVKGMDEILSYAKTLIGEIHTELQTNGYFNAEVRQWIYDHFNIVWISTDGPADIHDQHRVTVTGTGSSQTVLNNLTELLALRDKGTLKRTIGVRATISSYNLMRQKEMIDFYHHLGVRAMLVSPLFKPVGKKEALPGEIDYLSFGKQFLSAHNYANSLGMFYGTFTMANFDERVPISCRALLPSPHLIPDGFVSACEMCYEPGSELDIFLYGTWDKNRGKIDYDSQKIALLQSRTVANLDEPCRSCDILENCAGGCAGEVFSETGSLYQPESERCKLTKYLAQRMVRNNGLYPYFHS